MKVERIELFYLRMPLIHYFETSFERAQQRTCIIVKIFGDGISGYGEIVASSSPFYSYETVQTARHILREFIVPCILGHDISRVEHLNDILAPIRGHNMAKAGVEAAFWDAFSRAQNISLAQALGGTRDRIEVGVSIGIQDSVEILTSRVEHFLKQGYRRIKIKIKPGWDVSVVEHICKAFGEISLMVDANGAYSLEDIELFKKLDEFELMMIEQPLAHDDLVDHAELQRNIHTPICLDESISSASLARAAIELASCKIVNIKPGRVGGLLQAKKIHDLCQQYNIPVWCGGMLETGVGRIANVALASLPNFVLPNDISASSRYYEEDIVDPAVEMNADSTIVVPEAPGLGVAIVEEKIYKYCQRREIFR